MAADHGHRKCGIAAAVHKSLALHIAVQIDFLIGNSVVGKKFLDLAAVRTAGKGINSHRFVRSEGVGKRGPVLFQGLAPDGPVGTTERTGLKRF